MNPAMTTISGFSPVFAFSEHQPVAVSEGLRARQT